MKKKLFFICFLMGFAFVPEAFASIHAYLYDGSFIAVDPYNSKQCVSYESLAIIWSSSEVVTHFTEPYYVYFKGRNSSIYAGSNNSYWGGAPIGSSGPNYTAAPCTMQSIAAARQSLDQNANQGRVSVGINWMNPDQSQEFIESNNAILVNPPNAPISSGPPNGGSPTNGTYSTSILTPPELTSKTADPINIATGEDYFSAMDFAIKGRGPTLKLARQYRSFSTVQGMFGYGWRTDFDLNLSVDSAGDVAVFDGRGVESYFTKYGSAYIPSPGNFSTLAINADNTYTITDPHGKITHYDINGRLNSVTDRNGNALTFFYDPTQAFGGSYIEDASGRKIRLFFDSKGRVMASIDPDGHLFKYGYDTNGNLVSVTDPTGAVTNYDYDANHHVIEFTNANNHKTYYQYNSQGEAISSYQDNNVNKVSLSYSNDGNDSTVVTDSLGKQSNYTFNDAGLLLTYKDPLGNTTQQSWDPLLEKITSTDANGNTTQYAYFNGNLISITYPPNPQYTSINITYTSKFNLISSVTDTMGNVTKYSYDTKGNLVAIADPLGNKNGFVYDAFGDVTRAINSRNYSTYFGYDTYGNVLNVTDPFGHKTSYTYDNDGNVLTTTDALANKTSFAYDKLNRLLSATFTDKTKVSYGYDLFGNQVSVTDQLGRKLLKGYDAYERLLQTQDPLGGATQFKYDVKGQLLSLVDANGHVTKYYYDADGRVLEEVSPLNFGSLFAYDADGNVVSRKDYVGNTTQYTYDPLNRLTNIAYADGSSVVNVYDALGRKTSMTDSTGETSYAYDADSRLLSKTEPAGNVITYTYDAEGNRLTTVDQNGRTVTNAYDALNRLIDVADPNGKTGYGYDANSNRIVEVNPNGGTVKYNYDALNRVLTSINRAKSSAVITSFSNTYNAAGMITKKLYADGSWSGYSYDNLNRLIEEAKYASTGTLSYANVYTYDAVGNRLTWSKNTTLGGFWSNDASSIPPQVLSNMTTAGFGNTANPTQPTSLARTYSYDNANRLTGWDYAVNIYASTFPVETNIYAYDRNGNRLEKKKTRTGQEGSPQETQYRYDDENRLKLMSYLNIAGVTGTDDFYYNGDGLRTQVLRNKVASDYLYDGTDILIEKDGNGNTTKSYTREPDTIGGIGGIINQSYVQNNNSVVQYYNYDDLGSVSDLTSSTGASAGSYSYDAFGNVLTQPAISNTNRYLFSTKEFDSRSGLDFYGARYYDSEIGRWLTPDPLGYRDGLNRYTYVHNSPVNFVDPNGQLTKKQMTCIWIAGQLICGAVNPDDVNDQTGQYEPGPKGQGGADGQTVEEGKESQNEENPTGNNGKNSYSDDDSNKERAPYPPSTGGGPNIPVPNPYPPYQGGGPNIPLPNPYPSSPGRWERYSIPLLN